MEAAVVFVRLDDVAPGLSSDHVKSVPLQGPFVVSSVTGWNQRGQWLCYEVPHPVIVLPGITKKLGKKHPSARTMALALRRRSQAMVDTTHVDKITRP